MDSRRRKLDSKMSKVYSRRSKVDIRRSKVESRRIKVDVRSRKDSDNPKMFCFPLDRIQLNRFLISQDWSVV